MPCCLGEVGALPGEVQGFENIQGEESPPEITPNEITFFFSLKAKYGWIFLETFEKVYIEMGACLPLASHP